MKEGEEVVKLTLPLEMKSSPLWPKLSQLARAEQDLKENPMTAPHDVLFRRTKTRKSI